MYVPRTIEAAFDTAAAQFPVTLVVGARQVGKTTLLKHRMGPERTYVTLDDPLVRALAVDDPALFLKRYTPPLLIDEIQYAPGLLPYIKMDVDTHRIPNRYWLTGSQHFHVMKNISETLAGRTGIIQLHGFSFREILGKGHTSTPFIPSPDPSCDGLSLKDLYYRIWRGAMPEIARDDRRDKNLYYSSYVQTYLKRDIHDLTQVADEAAFMRFVRASAARSGSLLNTADLARDSGVAPNTAKHWLSVLTASGTVFLLQPYFSNITKRLIKSPKLYFLDTGLCTWLTEWTSPETLEAGAFAGAVLETWVVSEFLKSWHHNGKQAPFYHFRDKDKKEIDLLIVTDGKLFPVEIKKTASPRRADIRAFSRLDGMELPVDHGALSCLCDMPLPLTETVTALPVGCV